MAEIKIEKKKPVWPWILLVLVILAAIAYFVYANNEADDISDDSTMEEVDDIHDDMELDDMNDRSLYDNNTEYSNSTNALLLYSDSIKDSTRIGTDSTYTKTALTNLAKAVTWKAEQNNLESSKAMEDLKSFTSQMDSTANSTSKPMGISKNIKTVSNDIVNVLETLQAKKYTSLQKEVGDLRQTTTKITTMPLDKQKTALQAFLRKANEVLNKMNP